MSALNENIKKFREFRKMTQKQFSERLSKSRNVISNWERGENSPDPDTIEQICRILDVTPNMLFGWEPCPEYLRYESKLREHQLRIRKLTEEKLRIEEQLEQARIELQSEMFLDEN